MTQAATLYRMHTADHICPYGLRSKDLLERQGFKVDDHLLKTPEEADAFKTRHDVETTPQTWIEGERIGGFDALQRHFGVDTGGKQETTYLPVIAIFVTTALMALAASWATTGGLFTVRAAEWFIAFSMCVLGIQKLRDLEGFLNSFITYDLLAMRHVRYAYVYPFVETGAGILMIAGALSWLSGPAALFIAGINGVSVFKAVYIDRRDLKCACVGGDSNVPLGIVSLTENIMMVLMAIWMMIKHLG